MGNHLSLKEYLILGSSYLLLHNEINGEVVYTDIVDINLAINYDDYLCDLNADGIEDYTFIKFSGSYIWWTSSGFTELRNIDFLQVNRHHSYGTEPSKNEIAGYGFSTYFSYMRYWPFALAQGTIIDSNLEFNNYGVQIMAIKIDTGIPSSFVFDRAYGYWWPIVEDHYLGLHFIDADSNYHYGWVRCSVLDSAEVLVIKDYAYETEIEHPIVAGDTISYVGINEIANALHATVYSFGKTVYVQMETVEQESEIKIYTTSGALIYNNGLSQTNSRIDLSNKPAGSYVVEVRNMEAKMTKVVVIE